MITTSMRPEDKDAACNAGADAYLLLPVRPDEIVAEVRRAMRLGRSTAGRKQSGALHQGARNVGPRGGKRS
jgi:DNA-binding response OmpR family regulator